MADLAHITPAEVERSLKSSKIKRSAFDPLPGTLVKNNTLVVPGPISRIINKSIVSATVPSIINIPQLAHASQGCHKDQY